MHGLSSSLQDLLATELSRGRWTTDRLVSASETLGFGKDGPLKLEWNQEIDDEFAINAWRDAVKRTWSDTMDGSGSRRELKEALKVLGQERGSKTILDALQDQNADMDPDQARRVLEVPADITDEMLIITYQLRVSPFCNSQLWALMRVKVDERPAQLDRMRAALSVITEHTQSERLRTFLDTGYDRVYFAFLNFIQSSFYSAGERKMEHPLDWPRGLNQLGNTCYLNSLRMSDRPACRGNG
jgi:ubiquitin carboxyl-terminal hydrolase 25